MSISPDEMTIRLQGSLRQIRGMLRMTATDFAEYMGITRQTVNNLEGRKSALGHTQVIAVLSIIDHKVKKNSNEWNWIQELLGIRLEDYGTDSFQDFWFHLTGLYKEEPNTDRKLSYLYDTLTNMSTPCITVDELVDKSDKIYLFYDFLMKRESLSFLRQLTERIMKRQKTLPLIVLRTHLQAMISLKNDDTQEHIITLYEEMNRLKQERLLSIENSSCLKANFDEEYHYILQEVRTANYMVSILTESEELCEMSQRPCFVYGLKSFLDVISEIR